jgi:hypothetical protein
MTVDPIGVAVSIPAGDLDACCCECCQVDVCVSSWSLVQRSSTESGVSECDTEPQQRVCRGSLGLSNHVNRHKMTLIN